MRGVACIDDLREIARYRLPRWVFDYADGGSYDERTLRANAVDLALLRLRQRVMVDVSQRLQATTILGESVSMPLGIAPVGLGGFFHPDGEIHGARAAQAEGIPFALSTVSICSIEDVRAAVNKPFWFQIYVMKDRGLTRSLIERAQAAQCSALVLTLDLPLQAQRHRDIRNGLAIPPKLSLPNLLSMACHPRWSYGTWRAGRYGFGNFKDFTDMTSFSEWVAEQFDPSLNWDDVRWIRDIWPGKLILKGILDPADAREGIRAGADAIVVSNHGGRQLDGVPSSISVLPAIAEEVADEVEILFDGGIRGGNDVIKALALGARACLIGKSYLWGLAAGGEQGVRKSISLIRKELDVCMALTGSVDLNDIDSAILQETPFYGSHPSHQAAE